MGAEDDRLAQASRALRRELGLRQEDLVTTRYAAQAIEAGRAGELRLDLVRSHFAGLGAKPQLNVWWHGSD